MRQTTNERGESGGGRVGKTRQEGFALITALLVMLILTVLGVSAMTMTSMENRIAGVSKTTEAASMAVESCLGAGVNVIQQTIEPGAVPASALDSAPVPGPVPAARQTDLGQEIMGELDQNNDSPTGTGEPVPIWFRLWEGLRSTETSIDSTSRTSPVVRSSLPRVWKARAKPPRSMCITALPVWRQWPRRALRARSAGSTPVRRRAATPVRKLRFRRDI